MEVVAPEVVPLPQHLDEKAARLPLQPFGAKNTELSLELASCIGVAVAGPCKPEHDSYGCTSAVGQIHVPSPVRVLEEARESVSPTCPVTVYGRGVGVGVRLKYFERNITGGMMSGLFRATVSAPSWELAVRRVYFATTLHLSSNVHRLALSELLLQPTGMIANNPSDALPLSNPLALPARQVGLRVDL